MFLQTSKWSYFCNNTVGEGLFSHFNILDPAAATDGSIKTHSCRLDEPQNLILDFNYDPRSQRYHMMCVYNDTHDILNISNPYNQTVFNIFN